MKKLLALLLALAMGFSMTACGGQKRPNKRKDRDSKKDTHQTQPAETTEEQDSPENFAPQVLMDNSSCKITVTAIAPDDIMGYTLKVTLENKTEDVTLMFSLENATVDGVMCGALLAEEVTPGKKSNTSIILSSSSLLEAAGMDRFTDIALALRVYDSNDWTAEDVAKERVHIYPCGEENARTFYREPGPEDQIIVDNDHVAVIVTGYVPNDIWGYTVKLYLINKTDTNIMFSVDDTAVNGYMIDPFFASGVAPGCTEFETMSFDDSQLEEAGIEVVEEIEFTLRAYNENSWSAGDLCNESITLNP